MLKEGRFVGGFGVARSEVRAFTQKQINLVTTFANQAVIALENVRLFKELQARNVEITEALEQQTATAEILRVISGSPTDIQPVLDAVAESAARLCDASDVLIRRVEGDLMRVAAHFGAVPLSTENIAVAISAASQSVGGRAILERRTVHVHDILDPQAREDYAGGPFFQRQGVGDYRTMLAVPLLREETAIGIILIRRPEVRPFSDKQIKLLETFAAQAVIAIENVRLFCV
jgi:GAF domain-containing protein